MELIKQSALEFARRRFGYRFPRLGRRAFDLAFTLAPKHLRTELVRGIFVDLDLTDEVQRATYWQGERFEYPTLRLLNRWVDDGATHFFDIGSNYGFFSFALLASHAKLRADAFEPNALTFARLTSIKTQNDLDRLRVWNLGLGDQCSTLILHHGVSDSGHSTFGDHPGLRATETDSVEVLDFETWRGHAGVALPEAGGWIAKIDVEGFEMKVLSGLRRALTARAFRGIVVEVNEFTLQFCGNSADEIFELFRETGYKDFRETAEGRKWPLSRCGNAFFVPAEGVTASSL